MSCTYGMCTCRTCSEEGIVEESEEEEEEEEEEEMSGQYMCYW